MSNRDFGPTYISWRRMRQRVKHRPEYAGTYIDPRWDVFANFLADMGERPEGKTLGRINNDGHYTKNNCRWETARQQAQNRSSTSAYGPYIFMEGRSFRFEVKRLGVLRFFKTFQEAEIARARVLQEASEL
jgi:hypothetical protein